MTNEAKIIKNILNVSTIPNDTLNQLIKDRLDFGFDSLYFRYAELCDELAAYISRLNGTDPVKEMRAMAGRKQHFYKTLEQLVHAHDQEETK